MKAKGTSVLACWTNQRTGMLATESLRELRTSMLDYLAYWYASEGHSRSIRIYSWRHSNRKNVRGCPRIDTWEDVTEQMKGRSHEFAKGAANQHSTNERCWRQSERRRKKREPADRESLQKREKPKLWQESPR